MPIEITTALIGIISALLGGWAGAAISRKSATDILRKEQFFNASSKFRATVIYELSGFYPIKQFWEKNDFCRLYNSIPKINCASAEFRYFTVRKTEFDEAVEKYNQYCRETYEKDVFNIALTSMNFDTIKAHKERFDSVVKHLLSFANEN